MNGMTRELEFVGDALQRAWHLDHDGGARSRRRRQRLLLALALVALAVLSGGAIGAVLKSSGDAERGLLGGSWLFHGSNPRCEPRSATSFHCTLDEPPNGMTFYDEDGRQVSDVFLGLKRVTVDSELRVDGACVSLTADGRSWDCFLGEEAVARGLLDEDLLGRYWPEPPAG